MSELKNAVQLSNPLMEEYVAKNIPYMAILETTGKCTGACLYCYSSSTGAKSGHTHSRETLMRVVDECKQIGMRGIFWQGGDPLLHPNLFELMEYNLKIGQENVGIQVNPASITPKVARELCRPGFLNSVGIHIDSINQEVYNKVHTNPKTLQQKIRGYQNLLEAGYPPERTWACICLTKPAMESIEETIDWFLDEMGAGFTNLNTFRPVGLSESGLEHLELSLSDMERAYKYRAQKMGDPDLLRIGSGDARACCKSYLVVKDDGGVSPCTFMQHVVVGNIYQESLVEIFNRERDRLLFNFEIKGLCGECENNDVCFGCRANALLFCGDMQASDPKCWLNPANKEEYVLKKGSPELTLVSDR